MNRIFCITK